MNSELEQLSVVLASLNVAHTLVDEHGVATASVGAYSKLNDSITAKIAAGQPFIANKGAFMTGGSGSRLSGGPTLTGKGIAGAEASAAVDRLEAAGADYWIYSYDTPIVARLGGVWYMIPGKYSRTTDGQQRNLREALKAKPYSDDLAASAEPVVSPTGARNTQPAPEGGLDLG